MSTLTDQYSADACARQAAHDDLTEALMNAGCPRMRHGNDPCRECATCTTVIADWDAASDAAEEAHVEALAAARDAADCGLL